MTLMHYMYPLQVDEQEGDLQGGAAISPAATLCLLRGRAFEACQNRTRAVVWYKHALSHDAYCYDAFRCVFEGGDLDLSSIQHIPLCSLTASSVL